MKSSEFNFIDRGKERNICFLPGWASDYRVFGTLAPEYNYLVPAVFSPFDFKKGLVDRLKREKPGKTSLLGWSLGGFAAAEFAREYPALTDKVILVSVIKKYPEKNLENIRRFIKKDKKAFLRSFYGECFSPGEPGLAWFRENLMRTYIEGMEQEYLQEGLDYLAQAELNLDGLKAAGVKLVHGEEDKIAPYKEAQEIKKQHGWIDFLPVKNTGHMPFLNPLCKDAFD